MAIDFGYYSFIPLGVVIFALFCIEVAVVIRDTIREHRTLAKCDFLHAAEEIRESKLRLYCRDERIREANDQTQRGDAR